LVSPFHGILKPISYPLPPEQQWLGCEGDDNSELLFEEGIDTI